MQPIEMSPEPLRVPLVALHVVGPTDERLVFPLEIGVLSLERLVLGTEFLGGDRAVVVHDRRHSAGFFFEKSNRISFESIQMRAHAAVKIRLTSGPHRRTRLVAAAPISRVAAVPPRVESAGAFL